LIADHAQIEVHLRRHTSAKKISVIPYGAEAVTAAPVELLEPFRLQSKGYYLVIARPEPENSIIEIVRAFSSNKLSVPLVVVGRYSPDIRYQREVIAAAGPAVQFLGAIYDRPCVKALRVHARAYIHGHRVGGTNPSLVESLACGNAVIAHDNRFTRWVAGEKARFFRSSEDLERIVASLEENPFQLREMEQASRARHHLDFENEKILSAYERVLLQVSRSYD
jgi:glycosyltransferase involved in cell wall biosynthesis